MTRTHLAALALALGVAGVSCSDEPEPEFAPPESTSPAPTEPETTSEPPELAEPVLPDLAKANTAKGAEEFVRHYWAMAEYAQQTGDTDRLEDLGNTKCKACAAGVDYMKDVFARGGVIRGGATRVSQLSSKPFAFGQSSGFEVTARVHNTRQSVDFPEGDDESYPAGVIETHFFVEWTKNGWLVALWEQT